MAQTTSAHQILKSNRGGPCDAPERFWALIECYRMELFEQAASLLGDPQDAEDVVQETFYEAFRHAERLQHAQSIGAWLRAINRGNALNRLRSRKCHRKGRIKIKERELTVTTGGFNVLELRDLLNTAFDALPSDLCTIVKMRYFEHLEYKEIAAMLQMQIGAVQRRLVQASAILYRNLKTHIESNAAPSTSDKQYGSPQHCLKEEQDDRDTSL